MTNVKLLKFVEEYLDRDVFDAMLDSGIGTYIHAMATAFMLKEVEALTIKALEKAAYDAGYASLHNASLMAGFKGFKRIVTSAVKAERERVNKFS